MYEIRLVLTIPKLYSFIYVHIGTIEYTFIKVISTELYTNNLNPLTPSYTSPSSIEIHKSDGTESIYLSVRTVQNGWVEKRQPVIVTSNFNILQSKRIKDNMNIAFQFYFLGLSTANLMLLPKPISTK